MKRFILFFLLICLCLPGVYNQVAQLSADEKRRLAALPSNQLRCDTLNEWAFQRDGEASLPYANAAFELSTHMKYPAGSADALMRFGHAAAYEGNPVSAEAYYRRSLAIRKKMGDIPGQGSCYNMIGLSQKKRGALEEALQSFQLGAALFEDQPPHITAAKLYNNLASHYSRVGKYNNATEAFEKSLKVYALLQQKPSPDSIEIATGLASVRMSMAAVLQEDLNRYDLTRDSLQKSLDEFEKYQAHRYIAKCLILLGNNAYYTGLSDAALNYYNRALASDNLSVSDQAVAQKNRGRVYLDQHKFDRALLDFQSARDSLSRMGNREELASVYYELGSLHYEKGQRELAVNAYLEGLKQEPQNPMVKSNLLYYLPTVLDELDRHEEAGQYSRQYVEYVSSLNSPDTRVAMEETRQIEALRRLGASKNAYLEKQQLWKNIYIGTSIAGLLILGLAFLAYVFRSRARETKKDMQLAFNKQEMKTLSTFLEIQEATQEKISKELHDGLGSLLSTVKLHFASVENRIGQLQEESKSQYQTANRLLDHACEEVRRISHTMSSALVEKFGLKLELESLVDTIQSSGELKVELVTFGLEERLSNKIEINVYRMIQLLLHNIIEHAQAKKITINVNRFNGLLNIMIGDNGVGFNPDEAHRKKGVGMKNLETRVREFQGEIYFDTAPGQGCRVSIDLPLVEVTDPAYVLNN